MAGEAAQRDTRGLRGGWSGFQRHAYFEPGPELAGFVARYWFAAWDLRGQPAYDQPILPYPDVHLSFLGGAAWVTGVPRRHVVRTLEGAGRVFGIAFRPGCFRPFLRAPVATITDRRIDAREVFGALPAADMAAAADEHEMRGIAADFLRRRLPETDPTAEQAAGIVALAADDPAITRAEQLAAVAGMNLRGLQRLFAEYVGVGPKWVIRRYRLREVTERMAHGTVIDWAGLAADLGYADQAHFSRDFTAMAGETPTRYAQRYPLTG